MQSAIVTSPTNPGGQVPSQSTTPAPAGLVSFTRASLEHVEPFLDWTSAAITTAQQQVANGPIDVPAYGYMRAIVLNVEALGGTGTAAVYQADAPWSAIAEVAVLDVNGAAIFGPLPGYSAMLVNKWCGASYQGDPTLNYGYVTPTTAGNFSFQLRIPFELSKRDALGSLPNMNASQTYKLRITLAGSAAIYSTVPTGAPTVRVRASLEAWAPPSSTDPTGTLQAVKPPALGTTQFWTQQSTTIAAGQQTVRLSRVGNLIRTFILVYRTSAGVRTTGLVPGTNIPDSISLLWDGRVVEQLESWLRLRYMSERTDYRTGLDNGVLVYDMTHDFDGKIGDEMRDLWYQTAQSTRLEVQATIPAGLAGGTCTIITNDVAPSGNVFL